MGVISHVPELVERIDARLEISMTDAGSSRVRGGVGRGGFGAATMDLAKVPDGIARLGTWRRRCGAVFASGLRHALSALSILSLVC